MSESEHLVIPMSEDVARFECGHDGPTQFVHSIFGKEFTPRDEIIASREMCAECILKEISAGITQCERCHAPIFKGQDCIIYDNGDLCCLSTACGPGPIASFPGIWNGERFVDGFEAGTIKVL